MRLTHRTIDVPTRRTFRISQSATDLFRFVVVELEHDGALGLGEASPTRRVTGEDPTSVGHFLDWAARELEDRDISEWREVLARVHSDICGNPSARAALDLAMHDLAGKMQDAPARSLHGLPSARLETCMTVSLDAPHVMAEEARGYHDAGFRVLKLKLGDAAGDVKRVEAVRAACPDAELRADANTGWSFEEARALLPTLARLGVTFCEQPFRPEHDAKLAELARDSPLPLYADESVMDAHDVERLDRLGFRGGVNLKLQKTGGITPAVAAARRARELGYQVQLGCNVETAIGISGGLQLLSLLDHADLDGHLLLAEEPYLVQRPKNGWYTTPDLPGLGVRAASFTS